MILVGVIVLLGVLCILFFIEIFKIIRVGNNPMLEI